MELPTRRVRLSLPACLGPAVSFPRRGVFFPPLVSLPSGGETLRTGVLPSARGPLRPTSTGAPLGLGGGRIVEVFGFWLVV